MLDFDVEVHGHWRRVDPIAVRVGTVVTVRLLAIPLPLASSLAFSGGAFGEGLGRYFVLGRREESEGGGVCSEVGRWFLECQLALQLLVFFGETINFGS